MSDEQRIRGSETVERVGGPAKGEGRGGAARGYKWEPFQPGHELSMRHGAYSSALRLKPRAEELAKTLREAMGNSYDPRFEGAIAGAAMVAARLEKAMDALLESTDAAELHRLDADARGWMRLWFDGLSKLGLTPASAAQLGLLRRVADPLKAYIEAEYGEEPSDG